MQRGEENYHGGFLDIEETIVLYEVLDVVAKAPLDDC
jgi:hypothetical protein